MTQVRDKVFIELHHENCQSVGGWSFSGWSSVFQIALRGRVILLPLEGIVNFACLGFFIRWWKSEGLGRSDFDHLSLTQS